MPSTFDQVNSQLVIAGKNSCQSANLLFARFYLTSSYTLPNNNAYNYIGTNWGLATDVPNCVNATINSTTSSYSSTQLTLNTFNSGLIGVPEPGVYLINWFTTFNASTGAANQGIEKRLCVYSAPAWTGTNSAAKTYGVGQTAQTLANNYSSILNLTAYHSFANTEVALSWTGPLNAGTVLAPLTYTGSAGNTMNQSYITVTCLERLTP